MLSIQYKEKELDMSASVCATLVITLTENLLPWFQQDGILQSIHPGRLIQMHSTIINHKKINAIGLMWCKVTKCRTAQELLELLQGNVYDKIIN